MLGIVPTVLFLFSLACSVSAGVYGTSPIASTVWSAGRSESISWMDDSSPPRLTDMGNVDIELYTGDETLVATLAEGVDPDTRSLDVWVSPSWGHNGSDYYIRFTCDKPPLEVYTASFTILDMSTLSAFTPGAPPSQTSQTVSAPGESLYTPYLTLVLPDTTVVSALPPRTTSARPSSTVPPVSAQDEAEYTQHDRAPEKTSDAASGKRVDIERLKFRVVFILWPALIGITMAL